MENSELNFEKIELSQVPSEYFSDIQEIQQLLELEKTLEAYDFLFVLENQLQKTIDHPPFNILKQNYQEVILMQSVIDDDNEWGLTYEKDNTKIYWRKDPNQEVGCLKLVSEIEAPLFNVIACFRETEYYPNIFPFCESAKVLSEISQSKRLVQQRYNIPLVVNREIIAMTNGANLMDYDNSILCYCYSCQNDEKIKKLVAIPPEDSKYPRMNLINFAIQIFPRSANKMDIKIISTLDPKIPLPYSLLNWFNKKFGKNFLKQVTQRASQIEGTLVEQRIKTDPWYKMLRAALNQYFPENNQINQEFLSQTKFYQIYLNLIK